MAKKTKIMHRYSQDIECARTSGFMGEVSRPEIRIPLYPLFYESVKADFDNCFVERYTIEGHIF